MKKLTLWPKRAPLSFAAILLAVVAGGTARAQQISASYQVVSVKPSPGELVNLKITDQHIHISYRPGWVNPHPSLPNLPLAAQNLLTIPEVNTVPAPGIFPSDVSKVLSSGKVVNTAQSHAIFVNCGNGPTFGCWGSPDPRTFLTKLGNSTLIHVSDQYTGLATNGRYKVGATVAVSYPASAIFTDNDIRAIVHSAAAKTGSGYNHIYHVFLRKGQDVCSGPSTCYSPDMPSEFAFCDYHSSVTFSDAVGHVLYTVEPFAGPYGAGIPDCTVLGPSPNGAIVDSQANALSHEQFETITDPDPPQSFVALNTLAVLGQEIGDLCVQINRTTPHFSPPVQNVGGTNYKVQTEYSNFYHACAGQP